MNHEIAMRTYFSSHHLWASGHLIELAHQIEVEHNGKSRFDIKHRAYVVNSIFSTVAFMEAAVNELFQDATDGHDAYIEKLDAIYIQNLSDFWNSGNERRYSILRKYNKALELCNKTQFDEEHDPYKDSHLVTRLRNALVHYKPETKFADHISELEQQLQGKFQLNPLITSAGNPLFPDKLLGSDCAAWARDSCRRLCDEFFLKLEVIPNYQRVTFE